MTYAATGTGTYHRRTRADSQDRFFAETCGALTCICVSDGAGSAAHGAAAAELVCRAAGSCVLRQFERLFRSAAAEIQCKVMTVVLSELRSAARAMGRGDSLEEFGATLLLVCADQGNGRYIALHLGDGLIGAVSPQGLILVSPPMNGVSPQQTVLTSSPNCAKLLRLYRGQKKDTAFFLMTDGCAPYFWDGCEYLRESRPLLERMDWNAVGRRIRKKEPADDWTMLACMPEL